MRSLCVHLVHVRLILNKAFSGLRAVSIGFWEKETLTVILYFNIRSRTIGVNFQEEEEEETEWAFQEQKQKRSLIHRAALWHYPMSVDVYPMITATAPPPFSKDAYWRNCERPGRFQDWTLLGIALLAAIPFVCGNLVIFWYRKRKYFQAQGVDLVLASSTAGLIWLISAFVVNQHFKRQKGSFFSICPLWSFWLQFTLGFCFWLSLLALRLHHLYLLSAREKQMEALQIWLFYIPLLLTPSIIFSLFATVYDASKYIE